MRLYQKWQMVYREAKDETYNVFYKNISEESTPDTAALRNIWIEFT